MGKQRTTDLSYLREIAMGDEEIIVETTEAFLEDMPKMLMEMEKHFSNKEWVALSKLAHKVKPSLSYMGMGKARQLIVDIEDQAKTQEISEDLGNKIDRFSELCGKAFAELSTDIEAIKAS